MLCVEPRFFALSPFVVAAVCFRCLKYWFRSQGLRVDQLHMEMEGNRTGAYKGRRKSRRASALLEGNKVRDAQQIQYSMDGAHFRSRSHRLSAM